MSVKLFSKGKANQRSLSDRMKCYEEVTTGTSLIERLPIYARIDMRAGHTWCHGLDKPYDAAYAEAMSAATSYIVEKTGAVLGYHQSDEASFVYLDHTKVPFETRLFKLQSVLASMFTAAFIKTCLNNKLAEKAIACLPSFDCRVINMPNLEECANMILWRVQDSVKNSITLTALSKFSTSQIHKKNGKDKIQMLKEQGVDYYAMPEEFRLGEFLRRETYQRTLTAEEISKIPVENRPDEMTLVTRSHVVPFKLGVELSQIENRVGVLFMNESPILKNKGGSDENN